MVHSTQLETVTTPSENGDQAAESDGFELPRGTRSMYELTRGFSSRAKGAGVLADADALAELAGVHKDHIYQALDDLLEVHADPLSPNANVPGNAAHEVVAQYIEGSCDRRKRLLRPQSEDSILIGHQYFLAVDDLLRVAREERQVELDIGTYTLLDERRMQFEEHLRQTGKAIYGTNTGFGSNQDRPVSDEDIDDLQVNLIRSHATGVGDPAPIEVVRAAMLLRARSLANGNSGVRSIVVQQLIDFLNRGITPVVPAYGSVGASGDLAPLSHIALGLLGEGEVFYKGQQMPAAEALQQAGLSPLKLKMKEGLALNNGVQYSTAMAALASKDLETLLNTAALSTAITAQVMLGKENPYRADLHDLRPHPGSRKAATLIRNFMEDSPMTNAIRSGNDGNTQDPYNLRCSPQILGASFDLLDTAKKVIETEMNSATDNPLFLKDETTGAYTSVVSGGHFHGAPIAMQLYNLVQASANAANLIYTRCARYVDSARNRGMPGDLGGLNLTSRERATSSAMMIPEYVAAALANAIAGNAAPSHLYNFPTAQGQEDHVSMAPNVGIRLIREVIPCLSYGLAIELAYGAQAASIRQESDAFPSRKALKPEQMANVEPHIAALRAALEKELAGTPFQASVSIALQCPWKEDERKLSPSCQAAVDRISSVFPPVKKDRVMAEQLQELSKIVLNGRLLLEAKNGRH